ncbi:hypothetical protein K0M31_003373, partial [Melipona bicolor]
KVYRGYPVRLKSQCPFCRRRGILLSIEAVLLHLLDRYIASKESNTFWITVGGHSNVKLVASPA